MLPARAWPTNSVKSRPASINIKSISNRNFKDKNSAIWDFPNRCNGPYFWCLKNMRLASVGINSLSRFALVTGPRAIQKKRRLRSPSPGIKFLAMTRILRKIYSSPSTAKCRRRRIDSAVTPVNCIFNRERPGSSRRLRWNGVTPIFNFARLAAKTSRFQERLEESKIRTKCLTERFLSTAAAAVIAWSGSGHVESRQTSQEDEQGPEEHVTTGFRPWEVSKFT